MSYDASHHQFEQIIATIFTCRSIVKYNLALSEMQRSELLDDIDTALDVLRAQLITTTAPELEKVTVPRGSGKRMLMPVTGSEPAIQKQVSAATDQTLQALYRMYHVYLDTQQTTNINTFVTRFNEIMTIINELQRLIEANYSSYEAFVYQISPDDPLQRIRVFIADLYYIFMEFVRLLSDVLRQNNVHLNTDKLSSMRGDPDRQIMSPYRDEFKEEQTGAFYDFSSLAHVYANHQQLDQIKHLSKQVADTTAFLELLKGNIGTGTHKRDEVVGQISHAMQLLVDMQRLLLEYEQAASFLLHPDR